MVKIIFSNGESVEWNEGNLPDSVSINFDSPFVPDNISADHIDSLCNCTEWLMNQVSVTTLSHDRYRKYQEMIEFARERAKALREGR